MFSPVWRLTFMFGHAQAWIAYRRIAAFGTWRWYPWLLAWIPFRMIFCTLYAYQQWVYG